MNYEEEKFTTGMSAKVLEPLDVLIGTVAFVKTMLGMNLGDTYYDNTIEGIIKAVNQRYEIDTGVLLKRRRCLVSWNKLYDFERLPFGPSDIELEITPTTIAGLVIEAATLGFQNLGHFQVLSGNFADGITFEYLAGLDYVQSATESENNTFLQYEEHGQRMLDATLGIFNKTLSLTEASERYFQL
jgi:hypothetical protein